MTEKKAPPQPPREEETVVFGDELPVLPIRNAVLFPGAVAPFDVGREKSVALVEDVDNLTSPIIAIFAQKDPSTDDPGQDDLHQVGCAARVLKALKHSSGNYSLILQGLTRIKLEDVTQAAPYLKAKIRRLDEPAVGDDEAEALSMSLRDIAKQVIQLMPELPREAGSLIDSIQAPGALADLVAANLDAPVDEKAQLLETVDVKERIRKVLRLLTRQLEILKMRDRINSQIKEEMGKNQREYVLRQQLKAIKEELGEDEGDQGDLDGLEDRIAKASLPSEAEQVAKKQLKRLRNMQVGSAEYTVVRTYLDWIIDLPWHVQTPDNLEIAAVRKVLDEDHYGLEKVKKRILEYLAVRKLKKDKKGPILCLIGPPGVGKTSLGRSIARSLGRKFHRISLGGVHDEAAIRGHRRTYVGALPGQIIQGMKKVGTINPVFMLDEVDKIGHDFRGDPAAALLEVLDPEQNFSFADHYLEIPYDLSNVMFIATANVADPIPAPLRDRMEILEIPGYTRNEKLAIARRHLIPKQLEEHGIAKEQLEITDKALDLDHRPLHARSGRPHARASSGERHPRRRGEDRRGRHEPAEDRERRASPTSSWARSASAPRSPSAPKSRASRPASPGRASAARSSSSRRRACTGTGKLQLTGQLGDVMKESAQAALSYVRANAEKLGIAKDFLEKSDLHIHIPAGGDAEGRTVGRRDPVHGAHVDAHRHPRPPRRRDDRRNHAARPGPPDRRPQGEGPRGAPRRDQAGHRPRAEQGRPRRGAGRGEERSRLRLRHEDGASARGGARRDAEAEAHRGRGDACFELTELPHARARRLRRLRAGWPPPGVGLRPPPRGRGARWARGAGQRWPFERPKLAAR